MQTTLFEVKFYNGAKFNVFCANSAQINRFLKFILEKQNSSQIKEVIEDLLKIDSQSAMVYMLEKFSL